jgi:hypothetical protein
MAQSIECHLAPSSHSATSRISPSDANDTRRPPYYKSELCDLVQYGDQTRIKVTSSMWPVLFLENTRHPFFIISHGMRRPDSLPSDCQLRQSRFVSLFQGGSATGRKIRARFPRAIATPPKRFGIARREWAKEKENAQEI